MIYDLYKYQKGAKTDIRSNFMMGYKRVLLCMPTGSGKTVTFADIARDSVSNGFEAMVVVDRTELLTQAQEKLISYGLSPSLITAGKTPKKNAKCYIATVQTLMRRKPPKVKIIIIDEAHKQIFDKIMELEEYKDCLFIGATATPVRKGKMNQLSDYYDVMVESITIEELIQLGFLVPAVSYGAKVDTSNIKMKGQDYDRDAMFDVFNKAVLYTDVVNKYKKIANGSKAIVFNINVEHSKKVTSSFLNAGIKSAHLDGKTPKAERKRILKAFSIGSITVLNNVDVLTTGFDEWTIETVIMNRSTKSLPLFLQIAGRGSRITPAKFKGVKGYLQKEHFNFIDMGGNIHDLGFWEQEREYSLTHKRKEILEPAPIRICNEDELDAPTPEIMEERKKNGMSVKIYGCGAILRASAPQCKNCGYIFPKKKKEVPAPVEFIQLANYASLPLELVGKAFGAMTFEELEQFKQARGYKHGWIVKQIIIREDLQLIDYAIYKKYNHPKKWVEKMEKMYVKK